MYADRGNLRTTPPGSAIGESMYIAVHVETSNSLKAKRTAKLLALTPDHFVDHVLAPLWRMCAASTGGSGEVTGLDDVILSEISRDACSIGAVAVLISCGWIDCEGNRLFIHDWIEHQKYFANVRDTRERMRVKRLQTISNVCKQSQTFERKPECLTQKEEKEEKEENSESISSSTETVDGLIKTPTIALKRKPKTTLSDDALKAFEAFWSAFPRRVGKGAARRAWAKVAAGEYDSIQQGCLVYSRLRANEDPKFTVHPATWLNQERWRDENDLLTPDGKRIGPRGVRYDPRDSDGEEF